MLKIAANAQYFEDRAPWKTDYKMQGVKPPLAKAVESLIETGDFHVTTVGDNLPNENEVHEKYGSKSFLFTGSSRALSSASGTQALEEFADTTEEIALGKKHADEAEDLLVAMHEIIGHGSGKLSPKLTHDPAYYLKEYFSTLEEARADLIGEFDTPACEPNAAIIFGQQPGGDQLGSLRGEIARRGCAVQQPHTNHGGFPQRALW